MGAVVGYYVKHYIEKKKELTNEITKERRQIYQNYVNLIIDLFGKAKNPHTLDQNKLIKDLNEFYKKYVLYASPEVINAYSNFFQYTYQDTSEKPNIRKLLSLTTKIMMEMRKDLGLKNYGLGKNGELLMRAMIKDFDLVMK